MTLTIIGEDVRPSAHPLTLAEHVSLGAELHAVRERLVIEMTGRYRGSPGRRLSPAVNAIDKLRSALDSQLYVDHPDDFDVDVYYPGPGPRRSLSPASSCKNQPEGERS
jgi:hypothetical protein